MMFLKNPLGEYKGVYLAQTTSKEILARREISGGVVTSIACYILKKNFSDAVVAVKRTRGIEGTIILARTCEEVIEAAGSKWTLVPYMKALRDTIIEENIRRVTVIGLPCQINFLRQMKEFPLLETDFGDRVRFLIGLFCIGTFAHEVFKSFMRSLYGVKPSEIEDVKILGDKLLVYVSDGGIVKVPVAEALKYLQTGCLLCPDYTAVSSDISAGVLPDMPHYTVVITRTSVGQKLFERAIADNVIKAKPLDEKLLEKLKRRALSKMHRAEKYTMQFM